MRFQAVHLDDKPMNIQGEFAVRVDQDLVLEPKQRLNRTFIESFKERDIWRIEVYATEPTASPVTFTGPYQMQEHIGILVFERKHL